MIHNATIFRIEPAWLGILGATEDGAQKQQFVQCAPSQERASGWVPPRGEAEGALVESIGGQWLMKFQTEDRPVPADAIRRRVDERAADIEKTTGRKPGKRERKELKEEARAELQPHAFSRFASTLVWIDPRASSLVIGTASMSKADVIITALVQSLEAFSVVGVNTRSAPAGAMAAWLESQDPPDGFTIDRECELKATGESKSAVRYAKHPLDTDEVRKHVLEGMRPTRLAMTWDDRISFELTDGMQLRKLVYLEGVFDKTVSDEPAQDVFDADAAIATGELGQLIPALIDALGGEAEPAAESQAADADA